MITISSQKRSSGRCIDALLRNRNCFAPHILDLSFLLLALIQCRINYFFFLLCSVRPPNKSWKNISNLSGGEKTLSSLALVFALHHYKPTPLYVMDEIDAALDFKNVSIVAHYIKVRVACLPCLDILFPVFQYLSQKFQNNQLFKYLQI